MAPKKTTKAKSRKTVSRAKASKKSSTRSARKAPTKFDRLNPGQGGPIEWF